MSKVCLIELKVSDLSMDTNIKQKVVSLNVSAMDKNSFCVIVEIFQCTCATSIVTCKCSLVSKSKKCAMDSNKFSFLFHTCAIAISHFSKTHQWERVLIPFNAIAKPHHNIIMVKLENVVEFIFIKNSLVNLNF